MTFRYETGAMVEIEQKAVAENDDVYTFEAYSSVFGNLDETGDVMMPGAFKQSLERHGLPKLLYQHKMDDVVGAIVEAREDKKGLWIRGEMPKSDSFVSGRLYPQLKYGGIRSMSIGYRAQETERRKSDNARLLKRVRCVECSFVTVPANPLAEVTRIKGLVAFQDDLPIDRKGMCVDPAEAMKRIRDKFDGSAELKSAFLYVDEDKPSEEWDAKYLIADVNDAGDIALVPNLLYKAVACVVGARKGGLDLPEEAEEAIRSNLDRHYERLNLKSPFASISIPEWKVLSADEREVRLKGLGVTGDLAKALAATHLKGPREADRPSGPREVGLSEDAKELLNAFSAIAGIASAIRKST